MSGVDYGVVKDVLELADTALGEGLFVLRLIVFGIVDHAPRLAGLMDLLGNLLTPWALVTVQLRLELLPSQVRWLAWHRTAPKNQKRLSSLHVATARLSA